MSGGNVGHEQSEGVAAAAAGRTDPTRLQAPARLSRRRLGPLVVREETSASILVPSAHPPLRSFVAVLGPLARRV